MAYLPAEGVKASAPAANILQLQIDLDDPKPSASGKTLVLRSLKFVRTTATINGLPVIVSATILLDPRMAQAQAAPAQPAVAAAA